MKRAPLVTLTSDFGTRDGYVGSMKGRLLETLPAIRIIDITHEIAPFDITGGALALRNAVPHFPPGTVHLAVVDPGVGGARRAIIVATGREFLVGPDNGLFTPFLAASKIREIVPSRATRGTIAPTFHGRDLFAPVAARLAAGDAPATFGPAITDPVRLDWPEPVTTTGGVRGMVLAIDRFGNALTNLPEALVTPRGTVVVGRGRGRRTPRLVSTYAEGRRGELVALVGSGGFLEIARVEGSAALAAGDPVLLKSPTQVGGRRASRSRREM